MIKNGILKENPIFVLSLGLCSALAVTTTVEKSYMMGLSVLVILIISNIIVSLIRKIIPDNVHIPVYIIIVSTLVTAISLIMEKYVPVLYESFGIYLSLITVNCIILGRALSFANKNSVGKSILDAIGVGLGYVLSLTVIGLIRELLGNNSLTIIDQISSFTGFKLIFTNILPTPLFPINLFITPAGAFITIGVLMAIFNVIRRKYESN